MMRLSSSRFALLFCGLFFLTACRTTEDKSAVSAEHSNLCIKDLGGLTACSDLNIIGVPKDLGACCNGIRQLAVDSCQCNPAIKNILGKEGQKVFQLEGVCRFVQPTKWLSTTPFILQKCDKLNTHAYGCEKSDIEIDGERFASIQAFGNLFQNAMNEKQCLNTPLFAENMGKAVTSDVVVTVPYGVGIYTGIQGVSEYLGMAFAGLTHGYWITDTTPDPTKKARLEVSDDGLTWVTGSTGKGAWMRDKFAYNDMYLEQDIKFKGCETKISSYNVHPNEGMRDFIERIVQASELSKRWGAEDICRYHTKFCAGDPATKQYESETACLAYMKSLPLYTEACGPNRPLAGHSISCKLKHHFMIPANPKMHCPHIGPKGVKDMDAHMKCDDVAECGTDQGQAQWPPVTKVGNKIPADVRKVYEASNLGFEKEPFGCATPSKDEGTHIH